MDENKTTVLMDLIQQIENEISDLSLAMENNYDIKDVDWDGYEKQIVDIYSIINLLRDEIY